MTLLAGDGSDYDYSALSCASDTSFNPPPLQEEEAQKGAFYKRAQLAPDLSTLQDGALLSSARKVHAIINVGGLRYQLPWTTLEDFPLSRLGRLHLCSSFDDIMRICDDYDVTHNEFFFDRNPSAFRTILTFLRAGKLRSLREMCALSFREELLYWGVPEESLEWCCRRRLLQRMEEFEAMERAEEEEEMLEDLLDADSPHLEAESRLAWCMGKLRDMVEKPHSGLPGKIFACLSVLFVTITAVNLSISTMPAMREEEEAWPQPSLTRVSPPGHLLPDVLQHLHRGDGVRGLVLAGVHPALHPGPQQADVPAAAAEPDRRGGHPAVLHHPAGGQHLQRREAPGLRQQLPGQGGPGAARPQSPADPLRDASGSPLAGPPDVGSDGAPLHAGVRAAPPLPLRGHRAVFPFALLDRERDGRHAGVHQHPRHLLVGGHHHDDSGLRGHGAAQHPGSGGGSEQHPERDPAHGLPRHLHLPHLLAVLRGAEAGAAEVAPEEDALPVEKPDGRPGEQLVPGERHAVPPGVRQQRHGRLTLSDREGCRNRRRRRRRRFGMKKRWMCTFIQCLFLVFISCSGSGV
ncbi:potassium voltage-gated channel subfamily G member 1 isoform X1 [Antennarius striatus]|uniref:potassium voltage-gated channel subfamily G member 1 isoform X1 n=1 Tax=Antennarius striatus TaxID=241820 RepID=UPI0035B3F40C